MVALSGQVQIVPKSLLPNRQLSQVDSGAAGSPRVLMNARMMESMVRSCTGGQAGGQD